MVNIVQRDGNKSAVAHTRIGFSICRECSRKVIVDAAGKFWGGAWIDLGSEQLILDPHICGGDTSLPEAHKKPPRPGGMRS